MAHIFPKPAAYPPSGPDCSAKMGGNARVQVLTDRSCMQVN
jgi:hypothetical protein